MAKSKKQLYEEAVERNLATAQNAKKSKYKGMAFNEAKIKIGIRNDDESYDDQVKQAIK